MLEPMGHSSNYSTKETRPINSSKAKQLHLVSDDQSLYKSISAEHNENSVISYYPLLNITDLLARLQKCTIFSSLDLRSG